MQTKTVSVSTYIVLDSRANKEGLHKVYLRLIQDRIKKDHFFGIRWEKDKFDKINEKVLPRYQDDPDAAMHNATITEIKTRINRLSVDGYAYNRPYCIDDYIRAIQQKVSMDDFATFMEANYQYLTKKKIICFETYERHKSTLVRIKEFFGEVIPMSSITLEKIQEFDAYYRSKNRKRNTIATYHKVFKKYLNIAKEKELILKNPYDNFKFSMVAGDRAALTQAEVKKLFNLFDAQTLPHIEHEVLRRFLFSILTGLRISDSSAITDAHIKGNLLVFTPEKTKRLEKKGKIPLSRAARKLIKGRKGKLFIHFADQSINRILKRIAEIAGVNTLITYHSARDTFGTIFIELGGDVKTLCELMGHSSIRTTEIYLKMADSRKSLLISNFDIMLGKRNVFTYVQLVWYNVTQRIGRLFKSVA